RGWFQVQVRVSHAGDRAARRDSNVAECRVGGDAVVKGGSRLIGVAPAIFDNGKAKTGAGSGGAWEHAASRPLQTNMTPARSTYAAHEPPRSMDVPPAATMFFLHGGNGS